MKSLQLLFLSLALASAMPSIADKPDFAGKGKAMEQHGKSHADEMKMNDSDSAHDSDSVDDKMDKYKEKEKEKKAKKEKHTERHEMGKGSEQGQASREEHSKKWWKFWGDE